MAISEYYAESSGISLELFQSISSHDLGLPDSGYILWNGHVFRNNTCGTCLDLIRCDHKSLKLAEQAPSGKLGALLGEAGDFWWCISMRVTIHEPSRPIARFSPHLMKAARQLHLWQKRQVGTIRRSRKTFCRFIRCVMVLYHRGA